MPKEEFEEKQFLVCPKCSSTDLRWLLGGKLGDQYRCPKCSYQGIALRGNVKFIKQLKEKLGKEEKG